MIYSLLSQNFVVEIYALFPQNILDWGADSANFFAFWMYVLLTCVIVAWQNYDPLSLLWSNTLHNPTNMFMSTWTIPLLLTLCFVAWQNYDRHPLLTRVTRLPDSWTHIVNTLSLNVVNWSWNTYSSVSEKWQGISIITWIRDMEWMKVHPPYLQKFLVTQTF